MRNPTVRVFGFTGVLGHLFSSTDHFDPDDIFYDQKEDVYHPEDRQDSDLDDGTWQQSIHYVYDAAAERTQQRIREGQLSGLVNGVH